MNFYVYIITNKRNNVFYVGITRNLAKRIYEHKSKAVAGFSNKYNVNKLVYYEIFSDPENAIKREKQIKNWHRGWKVDQVNQLNPNWKDLYYEII